MRKFSFSVLLVSLFAPMMSLAATIQTDGVALNVTSVGAGTAVGSDGFDFFAARTPTAYNNFNVPDLESFPSYATYAMNYNGGSPASATQNYSFDGSFANLTINGTSYVTGTEYTAKAGGGRDRRRTIRLARSRSPAPCPILSESRC
jgi:hypothetical protein